MKPNRLPTVFVPHGGGPWPFVDLGGRFGESEMANLRRFLEQYPSTLHQKPKALLVISAHWEEAVATMMTSPQPPMLYDYYGFPDDAYQIQWPAPGYPELAPRVAELLHKAGFATDTNEERGYDHGTFVPLKVMYPNADMPILQLSMLRTLNPADHIRMGRALAPLRDEGILILGSGQSFHNLRINRTDLARQVSEPFDTWLKEVAVMPRPERERRLSDWVSAPNAKLVHPREEHLLPLMVILGAALDAPGEIIYNGLFGKAWITGVQYGR